LLLKKLVSERDATFGVLLSGGDAESRENRMLHGFSHEHRVQGSGNPGIHQNCIRA
jgi:hypothetical protein